MIVLDATRAGMLQDIQAPAELLGSQTDPTKVGREGAPEARCLLRGNLPAQILPRLNSLLARRCAEVAPERLERDLLWPLKKAVGNAHKRGNRLDPRKEITVEVVLTRAGVFCEVSDQGAGFDVAETLARFRAGSAYFSHGGSGFRKYTKARSLISFDRGGSTLRLRFLRERQATGGKRG